MGGWRQKRAKERGTDMVKKIIVVFLLIFFSPASIVLSEKSLTGFGGLEWGDSTSQYKELEPLAKFLEIIKDFQSAIGSGRKLKIGIESTTAPRYRFYKDRYYQFSIGFGDERDFTILEDALTAKYGTPKDEIPIVLQGKPNARTGVKLYWEIENRVSITLRWRQINQGELIYGYIPILEEIAKGQKESIRDNL